MQEQTAQPTIGIITRTKDREVLLHRALASVKNQSFTAWRLTIVNDGGDQPSVDAAVANTFGEDDRVRVIHHENSKGMEAASNAGLETLDTDYAVIHDDDDSWEPRFLEEALDVLQAKNSELPTVKGIVLGTSSVYEDVIDNNVTIIRTEEWSNGQSAPLKEGLLPLSNLLIRNQFAPIAFLYDLQACREVGQYDPSLPVLGDWEFNLRFAMKYDIWCHPNLLANYHLRETATGDLGNTVVAGHLKHMLFHQYLTNKWIREAADYKIENATAMSAAFMAREASLGIHYRLERGVRTRLGSKISRLIRKLKGKPPV